MSALIKQILEAKLSPTKAHTHEVHVKRNPYSSDISKVKVTAGSDVEARRKAFEKFSGESSQHQIVKVVKLGESVESIDEDLAYKNMGSIDHEDGETYLNAKNTSVPISKPMVSKLAKLNHGESISNPDGSEWDRHHHAVRLKDSKGRIMACAPHSHLTGKNESIDEAVNVDHRTLSVGDIVHPYTASGGNIHHAQPQQVTKKLASYTELTDAAGKKTRLSHATGVAKLAGSSYEHYWHGIHTPAQKKEVDDKKHAQRQKDEAANVIHSHLDALKNGYGNHIGHLSPEAHAEILQHLETLKEKK